MSLDKTALYVHGDDSIDDDGRVDMSDKMSDSQPLSEFPSATKVASLRVLWNDATACMCMVLSGRIWAKRLSRGRLSSFSECLALLRDDLRRRTTSAATRSSDFSFELSRCNHVSCATLSIPHSSSSELSSFLVSLVLLRDTWRRRTTSVAWLWVKFQLSTWIKFPLSRSGQCMLWGLFCPPALSFIGRRGCMAPCLFFGPNVHHGWKSWETKSSNSTSRQVWW